MASKSFPAPTRYKLSRSRKKSLLDRIAAQRHVTAGTTFKPEFKDLYPVDNSMPDDGPKIGDVIYASPAEPEASPPIHTETFTTPKLEPLGHTQDALGRYRPAYKKPAAQPKPQPPKPAPPQKDGTFSPEVERIEVTARRIKRDGTFRDRVLGTYGTACVICGYSVHVEAAHLDPKHQVSDDRTENGAPLCRNHHWELDHGHLTPAEVRRQRDAR